MESILLSKSLRQRGLCILGGNADVRQSLLKKLMFDDINKGKVVIWGNDSLMHELLAFGMSRYDLPTEKKSAVSVYLDIKVCRDMSGDFESFFAEMRRFGMELVVAMQNLDRLGEAKSNSVLGNIGSFVCFKLDMEEAIKVSRDVFMGKFTDEDLVNLTGREAVVKISQDESGEKFLKMEI